MKHKRIFIGFTDIAGVGSCLEKGFNDLGYRADFYYRHKHPYQYIGGKHMNISSCSLIARLQLYYLLIKMLILYDYIIYLGSGSGLLNQAKEIPILNFFRKKTMIIYTGCDVRMPEVVSKYRWNPCRNCPQDYKDQVGCNITIKKGRIRREERQFLHCVSPDECAGFIAKPYHSILFPVDLDKISSIAATSGKKRKLKILHAPSNKDYKGTIHIIKAIEKLRAQFDFEFRLVQNVSIEELHNEICDSDFVIDQMLSGFYGLFAIESMALGKPVVCFIREDLVSSEMPIINADPDTIFQILEWVLKSPDILQSISIRSIQYAHEMHSAKNICAKLLSVIENKV